MLEKVEKLEIIEKFLNSQDYCVLSSMDSEKHPHGATMSFSYKINAEIFEIYFSTSIQTSKAKNIEQNPNIAITFGWSKEEFITLQIQAVAKIAVDKEKLTEIQEIHIEKNPYSAKFKDDPNNIYIITSPSIVKYNNILQDQKWSLDLE